MARVFISHCNADPDRPLARSLFEALSKQGHQTFLALESLRLGDRWPERISEELDACQFFVVLLSAKALRSDMVTEEVRRARDLWESTGSRPVLLPIRVQLPFGNDVNYDLAGYLNRIQQQPWESPSDTESIISSILRAITGGTKFTSPSCLPENLEVRTLAAHEPPVPNAPLELPTGQVRLDSPYYVERTCDSVCHAEILRPGSLVRIKAPRQFGKTSLMSRILRHAKDHDYRIISLSLQLLDRSSISTLDNFLRQLCLWAAKALGVPPRIEDYWLGYEAIKMRCTNYFEENLLADLDRPVVLAIDEADRIFEDRDLADDFFSMLRVWHENAKLVPVWEKLRLVVAHSTEAYLALNNFHHSPFYNVGYVAELDEFTLAQLTKLASLHRLQLSDEALVELHDFVGGHPYLVRRALHEMAYAHISLQNLLTAAPRNEGPFGDHLRRHLWNIRSNPSLKSAVESITKDGTCADVITGYLLNSAGLTVGEPPKLRLRSKLYQRYFHDHL